MARRPVILDGADREKAAMLACSSVLARLLFPDRPKDDDPPVVKEAHATHSAAQAFRDKLLARGLSWTEMLLRLESFAARYPTPVLDTLRGR